MYTYRYSYAQALGNFFKPTKYVFLQIMEFRFRHHAQISIPLNVPAREHSPKSYLYVATLYDASSNTEMLQYLRRIGVIYIVEFEFRQIKLSAVQSSTIYYKQFRSK